MNGADLPVRVALVGLGRANLARQEALQQGSVAGAFLAATVSRRPGTGSHAWADVLADRSIEAVCIGTENASHAQLAAAALQAGKHVLVDFPLANSHGEAAALVALAARHQRVLHCEAIGLLTAAHQALRAAARADPLVEVTLQFQGGLDGWLAAEAEAGRHGVLAVGRLHQLDDLCGPLAWRSGDVTLLASPASGLTGGYRATLHLQGPSAAVTLVETRQAALPRGARWQGRHHSGKALEPALPIQPVGLFARDLTCFCATIRGTGEAYLSLAAVLRVLALAEQLPRPAASPSEV